MSVIPRVVEVDLQEDAVADPRSDKQLAGLKLGRRRGNRHGASLVEVTELRAGLRVAASKYVGVTNIPIHSAEGRGMLRVRVHPRHQEVTMRDVVAMALSHGAKSWMQRGILSAAEGPDLLDGVCRALVESAHLLLRRGPSRQYVKSRFVAERPRGRIDVRDLAVRLARGQRGVAFHATQHTLRNQYNSRVVRGLRRAGALTSDPRTKRRALALAQRFGVEPLCERVDARLDYGGQFAPYKMPHTLSALLARGLGADPGRGGTAAFAAFFLLAHGVYQRFLSQIVARVLPEYSVTYDRLHVFETDDGAALVDCGYLLPDLQVRSQDGRIAMIIDAKYEDASTGLPAGDFYQAYVYGDLLGRKEGRKPMPVVLMCPHHSLAVLHGRRALFAVDGRATRPITWVMGIPLGKLLARDSSDGAVAELRTALLALIAAPHQRPL